MTNSEIQSLIYQIYPLGLCGCEWENNGTMTHRFPQLLNWIPHLKKLGVSTVLFNPLFESEHHGYDTRDPQTVDVRLGTKEDVQSVCTALQKEGIQVYFDAVFNHVGRSFPMFMDVREKKWDSPYCNWFYIDFNNDNGRDGFCYADWEGHQELVKLNLNEPAVRNYLFSCVDLWVKEFGIKGLRIDVAYCMDRGFLHDLSDYVHSKYEDFTLLGEMVNGDYNVLLRDGGLDTVTNYECRKGLYSSMNSHNLFEIGYSLNRQFGPDPWCLYRGQHLLSFLDNHDVDRIASTVQDSRDLPLLYAMIFAMPGVPCVYYGSEWGALGRHENGSDAPLRPHFDKPEWNELTDLIAQLAQLRKEEPVFFEGDYHQLLQRNEQWVFSRTNANCRLFFLINIAEAPASFDFETGCSTLEDLMQKEPITWTGSLQLPAKSFKLLLQRF